MTSLPTQAELRVQLGGLDARQQKIVAGVLGVMIQSPERVSDREWISEQFTQVTLLASEFNGAQEAHAGLQEAESYLTANIHLLLNVSYALFAQVAQDLAQQPVETKAQALEHAMSYF